MEQSFLRASTHAISQKIDDIGYGIIIPDEKPSHTVLDATQIFLSSVIIGGGTVLNSAAVVFMGLFSLGWSANDYAKRGKKVRERLDNPQP